VKDSSSKHSWLIWLLIALVVAAALWTIVIGEEIRRQSWVDEARPADVIVVFGAAEYSGKPSPVFRARLDHGYELFQKHLAPVIITTGGAGGDPRYSEGGVGREYLIARGVPRNDVIAETQSNNTDRSVERVAVIMRTNGMKTCVAVSDPYHLFRVKRMLDDEGIAAYPSPRPLARPLPQGQRILAVLREVVSYTAWKLHLT
jgi:uncharacterized SAM-binding protein YcdF (DUF218 family)